MEFYQWLAPLVALFFLIRVIRQYLRKHRLFVSTLIWTGFWMGAGLLGMFPNVLSFNIAKILGFQNNINAIIFLSLAFLFILTYYATSMFEKLETQMTELVRKMAIENQNLKDQLHEFQKVQIENEHKQKAVKKNGKKVADANPKRKKVFVNKKKVPKVPTIPASKV